jgi:hypothetical protein
MRRSTVLPIIALSLAVACDTTNTTAPGPGQPDNPSYSHGGPSETTCEDVVITGTHDNVTVPPGRGCRIVGATILGNVKALLRSRLDVAQSTVHGNIDGDGAERFDLLQSTVGGNIFLTGGGIEDAPFGTPFILVTSVTVLNGDLHILKSTGNSISVTAVVLDKGSMKIEDNVPRGYHIAGNRVAQNLQVFKNKTVFGGTVTGNVVGGNLQCFDNDPPPLGGPNVAQQAQGQCFVGTP